MSTTTAHYVVTIDAHLDLRTTVPLDHLNETNEVERARNALATKKMDLENHLPNGQNQQINEEDLVETTLAQKFRRKYQNIVRDHDEKNRRTALLHPDQQNAEHAPQETTIVRVRTRARKTLLDLIDPQHHEHHTIDLHERIAQAPLTLTDEPVEERASVESQQQHLPHNHDHLRNKTLARTLHTEQHHTAQQRKAEHLDLINAAEISLDKPALESFESTNPIHQDRHLHELKHTIEIGTGIAFVKVVVIVW